MSYRQADLAVTEAAAFHGLNTKPALCMQIGFIRPQQNPGWEDTLAERHLRSLMKF